MCPEPLPRPRVEQLAPPRTRVDARFLILLYRVVPDPRFIEEGTSACAGYRG